MQVTGEFLFKGTRDQVWQLLNDETVLARCLPGCEALTRTGEDQFKTRLKVGLAAIKGTYEGTLAITGKQEPETVTIRMDCSGTTGFAGVTGKMDLVDQGPATKLIYDWDVSVGGPVAMVGQRVLGGVAKWIIGEFFNTAQKELAARQAS